MTRSRKREWWHALFDVAMGPVMGIPVVSGLAGEGVRQLAKLCGYHAFMPGNNLLVPFSNAADIGKAFSNAWKVFDGKERPWEDDALSFHELLRGDGGVFSADDQRGRRCGRGCPDDGSVAECDGVCP